MPTAPSDDEKAKLALKQQLAKEAEEREQAAIDEEQQQLMKLKPKAVKLKKEESTTDSDWQKLVEAYNESKYKTETPAKPDALVFEKLDHAKDFLKEQAEKKLSFVLQVLVLDPKTGAYKATGDYFLSCGTGKLYFGNLKQIHSELGEDKVKSPAEAEVISRAIASIEKRMSNNVNLTDSWKQNLKDIKKEDEPLEHAPPSLKK